MDYPAITNPNCSVFRVDVMTALADERFDVLVVGGGPAGSTVATLLARRGERVLLLEKERHPRFHIGESLLPMNLPLFEQLGVSDEIARIGIMKYGASSSLRGMMGHRRSTSRRPGTSVSPLLRSPAIGVRPCAAQERRRERCRGRRRRSRQRCRFPGGRRCRRAGARRGRR